MGIKHFFIWYKQNFPECVNNLTEEVSTNANIDTLCIDLNGLFHPCAQKTYEYGDHKKMRLLTRNKFVQKDNLKNKLRFFNEVSSKIDDLRRKISPKKKLILCIDGVAGCAKMAQQRQRRFRSSLPSNESQNGECEIVMSNSVEKKFNPSCLTPGTEMMDHLSKYLEWYIRSMISNSPDWMNLEVLFSSEKVPGEGEHKIINYIKTYKEQGITENICIHGLDADLIMLTLSTHLETPLYILREYGSGSSQLQLLDITKFKSQLINQFLRWESHKEVGDDAARFNKKTGIDDFIFLCFLVGNDFVPNVPSLAILEGGITTMLNVYRNVCSKLGHLTKISRRGRKQTIVFNLETLQVYLKTLSNFEEEIMTNKVGNSDFIYDSLLEKHGKESFNGSELDYTSYVSEFYFKKFGEQYDIKTICHEYLKGLQWVINYYRNGMPDWRWYFPYFYAPFLKELSEHTLDFGERPNDKPTGGVIFDVGFPVPSFLQLLSVMPPSCCDLLPSPLGNIIKNNYGDYYPTKFYIDCSGKRNEWEGIVNLPFINVENLEKEYNKLVDSVSEKDRKRNNKNSTILMKYTSNPKITLYKSFYGDIPNHSVTVSKIE
jgi:5'-3' exonuclease